MPLQFNEQIINEFRTNAGVLGGPFEGWVLLLLTTTGARSGATHTTPLGFVEDGDRLLVVGSAGGSDRHPDWYRNILLNPQVTVELGAESWQATAVAASGAERDELFARVVAVAPGYADYQKQTERVIPVVALYRIPVDDYRPPTRLDALADEIVKIHDWLRGELTALRERLDAHLTTGGGDGGGAGARPAAGLTVELRKHCLTFCSAMAVHHGGEDTGLFPYLAREFTAPEVQEALDRLRREHTTVARILDDLQALLARLDEGDPDELRAELARLQSELETHFAYEEEQIIPLLRA
ncbi:nitroreductase/quinone reductase family protein [Streptomyces sp. NPDC000410]|uniref:nitroreductase/quinone reductase family protein n=1 Tax=Streptomyces sp. NPDC000410 TaxID=3154254 RepID=UPI0033172453